MCEKLALYSQHWPAVGTLDIAGARTEAADLTPDCIGKKEALLAYPQITQGVELNRLLQASSYDYYNPGAKRY